jgi:apolipoprotein D and lipocalin family protein
MPNHVHGILIIDHSLSSRADARPAPTGASKMKIFILLLTMLINISFARAGEMKDLATVEYVDVGRYMGTWYEISRLPNWFEKGLVGVTAEYTLLANGKVRVVNRGHKTALNWKLKTAKGKAYIADKKTNAKLKVSFFWPFYGDYWILELGKDYEYALVGDESRKYLWVLARKPVMDAALYNQIVNSAREKGFDVSKLEKTPQ